MIHLCLFLLAAAASPSKGLPVYFEPNHGQVKGATDWIARAPGATLYLSSSRVAISGTSAKPRVMEFIGARRDVKGLGESATGGVSRVLSRASSASEPLPHFSRVRYRNLYPGIDLVYYSTPGREIEYDLEIAPGSDTSHLDLRFSGFESVTIEKDGVLSLGLDSRNKLIHRRPKAFQHGREVRCSYRRIDAETVRLSLGDHDPEQALTIDPVLDFSTYLGGPDVDVIRSVAVDAEGFVYVAGSTQSPGGADFDPFVRAASAFPVAFLAKLSPDADRILFLDHGCG